MGTDFNVRDFYKNDTRMKAAIKTVLYFILLFIAFYIFYATYKIVTGKHIVIPILGDINPVQPKADTVYKFITDTVTITNDAKNMNTGTMSGGHIGDESYNGIKQRTLPMQKLKEIISQLHSKSVQIGISYPYPNDKEGLNYANDISKKLKNLGYLNVRTNPLYSIDGFDTIHIRQVTDSSMWIVISPSSNVK
jgi:hypothetical protein